MADNQTGLIVKTRDDEEVRTLLVDAAGTNVAAVSAAGRLSVDGSGVTQPISGSVSISAVIPGTGATNLGKSEDTAHANNDVGVAILAVRNDAGGTMVGSDGDYAMLQTDASGALRVTGGGGGTEYTVNAAVPTDPTGPTMLMERDDALAALSEAEGDWTNPRANANGALWVVHDGTVTVAGTVAVSGTVTVDSELVAAAALADNTANPTVTSVGVFPHWFDGSAWDRAPGTTADGLLVNLGANNDVTVTSGSITADTELAAAAALSDSYANPTTAPIGAFMMGWDTADWSRVRVDGTTGRLQVDVVSGGGTDALVDPTIDTESITDLGAGVEDDIDFTAITTSTTGHLLGLDVSAAVPLRIEIATVAGGTPTIRAVYFVHAGESFTWRTPHADFITQTGGATSFFRASVTNLDQASASNVYATAFWDERA